MFTDIVGSTALVARLGDEAWAEVLGWHDSVLRQMFHEHMGHEVKQIGDGFFAVFTCPAAALACALDIQRALASADPGELSVGVRIGLHQAEVMQVGRDYVGLGVHEAARIAARAGRGEILVSVGTLVEEQTPGAGEIHTVLLRGVPGPVDIVAISGVPA
jgi:class 3 adenylate cyclase